MLVKFVDHKGKERYVNAMYVKSVTPKGENQSSIEVSGWATKLRVDLSPDAVAELVNAAMPTGMEAILADLEYQQQQAAAAAAM